MINFNHNIANIGYKPVSFDLTLLVQGGLSHSGTIFSPCKLQEVYIIDCSELYSTMADDTVIELGGWYMRYGTTKEYTRRNFNSVEVGDKTLLTKSFLSKIEDKVFTFAPTDIRNDDPKGMLTTSMVSGITAKLISGSVLTKTPKIIGYYDKGDNNWVKPLK